MRAFYRQAKYAGRLTRALGIAVSMFGAIVCNVATAAGDVSSARVIDWAGRPEKGSPNWSIQAFGPNQIAQLREAAGGALEAELVSADGGSPAAQLRFPVPFKPGRVYRAEVELSAASSLVVDVMLRRGPVPYDPVAIQTVTLGERPIKVTIEGSWPFADVPGDLRVVWRGKGGKVKVHSATVDDLGPVPFSNAPGSTFPPELIGFHVNKLGQHNTWPDAGAGLIRLWDTYTTWSKISPSPGAQEGVQTEGRQRLEKILDYVQANQPDATILFTLGQPPRWASDNPDNAKCAYGVGTCGAPINLDLWREYVKDLAVRYKGRIRHWELWNEPDHSIFYSSRASMVDLARVAQQTLKSVDPENKLISPGVTASTGLFWLHNFLEAGGGKYIDAVGFHWYFDGYPERLAPFFYNVRRVMGAHGVGNLPIWNTEGAPLCKRASPTSDCGLGDLSAVDAGWVTSRAILSMWANGVKAFAYYTVEGAGDRTIPLLTPDWKSSSQASANLKFLSRLLSGARLTAASASSDGVYQLTVKAKTGDALIVWTDGRSMDWRVPKNWSVSKIQKFGAQAEAAPPDALVPVGPTPLIVYGK